MSYYSQFSQDKYIYETFFKNKKEPGFFLEIGADDGTKFSNCKFFEETLNWKGIAIEPRNDAFNTLIQNRKCICLKSALSNIEETTTFLDIKGYGRGLSGLIDKYDPRHKLRIQYESNHPNNRGYEIIEVKTEKLNDILNKYDITNIDFLSIDTEGSELSILETIDFDKINIDVITIEDNYKDTNLMKFFIDRNYSFVKEIECDKIFKKN